MMSLLPSMEEMPANDELRLKVLDDLAAEGRILAHRGHATGELIWLEREHQEIATGHVTGISVRQLRPAFAFLVKEKGMSRDGVAKLFGIRPNTIGDAVKRYEETGGFKDRAGRGRRSTTTDAAHVEEARQHLLQNPRTMRRGGIVGNSTRRLGGSWESLVSLPDESSSTSWACIPTRMWRGRS